MSCGLSTTFLQETFPSELTLWIDPLEVTYRIGEKDSIYVLYEYKEGISEPWKPTDLDNKHSVSINKKHTCVLL